MLSVCKAMLKIICFYFSPLSHTLNMQQQVMQFYTELYTVSLINSRYVRKQAALLLSDCNPWNPCLMNNRYISLEYYSK